MLPEIVNRGEVFVSFLMIIIFTERWHAEHELLGSLRLDAATWQELSSDAFVNVRNMLCNVT